MRSLLFVPAHKDYLIKKALESKADAIIFDLEDSCPGERNKEHGLYNISRYGGLCSSSTITRISNKEQIGHVHTDYIMYPKAECIDFSLKGFKIILLIETALGIMNIKNLMSLSVVEGAAFGNEDYLANTGCCDYSFAQNFIVNCAKAYGKFAIDSVNADVHNLGKLKQDCKNGAGLGFDGKLCIHPKEIEIIHRYYTPTEEEYNHARRIIELYDQAEADGSGVAIIDGVYVAPPMVKYAQKIIKKYETYCSSEH